MVQRLTHLDGWLPGVWGWTRQMPLALESYETSKKPLQRPGPHFLPLSLKNNSNDGIRQNNGTWAPGKYSVHDST